MTVSYVIVYMYTVYIPVSAVPAFFMARAVVGRQFYRIVRLIGLVRREDTW
jgi:hypothetical protein